MPARWSKRSDILPSTIRCRPSLMSSPGLGSDDERRRPPPHFAGHDTAIGAPTWHADRDGEACGIRFRPPRRSPRQRAKPPHPRRPKLLRSRWTRRHSPKRHRSKARGATPTAEIAQVAEAAMRLKRRKPMSSQTVAATHTIEVRSLGSGTTLRRLTKASRRRCCEPGWHAL